MKKLVISMLLLAVAGCASNSGKRGSIAGQISSELDRAAQERVQPAQPEAVSQALLPPLKVEMPAPDGSSLEPKFDLMVNAAPAAQVFMGIVSGTRYSMLVHPEVTGSISVNLKDVNVFEALDSIRELYGYDYKVDNARIYIQPLTLRMRVFQVNYLSGERKGSSGIRVSSSSVSDSAPGGNSSTGTTTPASAATSRSFESSRITTTSSTDFWEELTRSLNAIVGNAAGRSVVVNPHSGMVVVRAMPDELRNVEAYLKASQIAVERQVVLEAKIIEVRLSDGYQAGINWAAFKTGPNSRASAGVLGQGATLQPGDVTAIPIGGTALSASPFGSAGVTPGTDISSLAGSATTGGLFGLAIQTGSFAALISFLETQGAVHVLSSPRIATLNDQKAVLKVGTDEFFITNVSTTSTTTTSGSTTPTANVTVQPFFSGIALDVTPRIDENNNIILHIHPSVSTVAEKSKNVDLGAAGKYTLPLASSDISETDSIVRAQDGQIVAIGGLMRQTQSNNRAQVPGLGSVPGIGMLFGQTVQSSEKRELVILLKPTVIQSDRDWADNILETRDRIQSMERGAKP